MNPDPAAGAAGSWRLGEWTVNRLGLGAMRLTGTEGALGTAADRAQSIRVLRRAIELGVNHIDTAAFYVSSLGPANELIRQALSPYPDDLVITTKVVPGRGALGEPLPATGPEQLRSQVVENLRQLGLDSLQVVNLRLLGPARLAEHFGALADLRAEGLIGHLGISAVRPDHLAEAQAIAPVVCVQNRYNLDEQMGGSGELMLLCGQQTIAFVPYFAIAGKGREAGADRAHPGELLSIARAHRATPAQIRLAWTLGLGGHVLAIPGTGNPAHLEENVAAGAIDLTPDEMDRLGGLQSP